MVIHWKIQTVRVAVLLASSFQSGLCQYYPAGYVPASSASYQQNYGTYPSGPDSGMFPQQHLMNYGYQPPQGSWRSAPEYPRTDLAMKSAMAPLNSVVSSVAVPPAPMTTVLGALQAQPQRSAAAVSQANKPNCTSGCSAARSLEGDNVTSIEHEEPQPVEQPLPHRLMPHCQCWLYGFQPPSQYPPQYSSQSTQYPPQYSSQSSQYPPQYSSQSSQYPPQAQLSRDSGSVYYFPMVHRTRQPFQSQYRPYGSRPLFPPNYYYPYYQGAGYNGYNKL